MVGLRNIFVVSALALSAISSPAHAHDDGPVVDWSRLSALLDSIDPAALHQVLHSLAPKYKEGVFSKDRSAVEVVHSENPAMATKLVYIAKRQNGNSTAAPPPQNSPSTPAQSSEAESISSMFSAQRTASELPGSTTVHVAPSTPAGATPIRTVSNGVVFSTIGGGIVTESSVPVGVHFTKSTSTHLYYTTLPDGTVQTSTSLVIVNAPVTDTADATGAGAAASTSAGLQNGAVKAAGAGAAGAFAGALGFLVALL